jgi:peptidoglycan LD-endopeptidase CwlK
MTKLDRRRLFARRFCDLLDAADKYSIPVAIFAYYRTAEEQHKLFLEGKSKCDGYQRRSKHQDWLAVDLGIVNAEGTDFLWTDPRYAKLGELGESLGLTWGGRWDSLGDVYHFELGAE